MRPNFTLRQLEIFLAIARTGHLTRAAEGLHLSQSAASAALAEIEERLGGAAPGEALFVREGRGLKLTDRGRRLADEAARLLGDAAALPSRLGGVGGELVGELRLAASQTIGRDVLAAALAGFATQNPGVGVRCRVASTGGAIAALLAHEADAAYVEGEREVGGPGLIARPWRRDTLEIVTAPGNAGNLLVLTPEDLPRLPWVLRETGSGTRERFDVALREAGLPPVSPRMVFDDTEAVRHALRAGFGWSCLPRLKTGLDASVPDGLGADGLLGVTAPFLDLGRRFWRVVRRGNNDGPLLTAFETHLESVFGGAQKARQDLLSPG